MRLAELQRDLREFGLELQDQLRACGPQCPSLGATAFHLSQARAELSNAYHAYSEAVAHAEVIE